MMDLLSNKEKIDTVKNYISPEGALKRYPSREKKKIIVLEEIAKNFLKGKIYSEKDVNRI